LKPAPLRARLFPLAETAFVMDLSSQILLKEFQKSCMFFQPLDEPTLTYVPASGNDNYFLFAALKKTRAMPADDLGLAQKRKKELEQ
jgi:hypothetical protein